MTVFRNDRRFAAELDRSDELGPYRARFSIPRAPEGEEVLYFCGHSLGLQPKGVQAQIEREVRRWADHGVAGHFAQEDSWIRYHETAGLQTAAVVGGLPSEVVIMNSLTVNLHLMMVTFYRPTASRHRVAMETHPFPSDLYAITSQIRFHGFDPATSLVQLRPRAGESALRTEEVDEFLKREGESIALILLGGVNYYTGQAFDLEALTRRGHEHGCAVGYDLAHAAGNIPLRLHAWEVDFAVWCSYKYLNCGPGSPAGCFVHDRHGDGRGLPRFAGWWGHDRETRFLMGPEFVPMAGAHGWQVSNQPILALAAMRPSLALFQEVGMARLREKSVRLTGYLEFLIQDRLGERVTIITPSDPAERGAQLSLKLTGEGRRVYEALTARGVVCDWREPNVLRVAPVPLYNTYEEVFRFVEILESVIRTLR